MSTITQLADERGEQRGRLSSTPEAGARKVERLRYLVELQGFVGLDDATVVALEPWLRFSPALCMVMVLSAVLSGRFELLLALLPLAIGGIVLPTNPFDAVYNLGIRRFTGGPRIPRYGLPRRFACAVGSLWIVAMWLSFHAGAMVPAYVLGAGFVAVSSLQVFTGLCLPSLTLATIRRRLKS
ncbi:MAG: DUF4395 domain-containing protein [Thermoanaerobaculia bacterium]|nr:DUF4395 domain-containing protein [Thermoanaerobaculia bacterium]